LIEIEYCFVPINFRFQFLGIVWFCNLKSMVLIYKNKKIICKK
jgi:hypothetical protein